MLTQSNLGFKNYMTTKRNESSRMLLFTLSDPVLGPAAHGHSGNKEKYQQWTHFHLTNHSLIREYYNQYQT